MKKLGTVTYDHESVTIPQLFKGIVRNPIGDSQSIANANVDLLRRLTGYPVDKCRGLLNYRHAYKFNPYHEPAGSPEGGEFASADGGDGKFNPIGVTTEDYERLRLATLKSLSDANIPPTLRPGYSPVSIDTALNSYTAGGSGDINGIASQHYNASLNDFSVAAIQQMDKAFDVVPPLEKEIGVYRGFRESTIFNAKDRENVLNSLVRPHNLEGQEFIDHHFVSTSISNAVARRFVSGQEGFLLHISIPAGSKVIVPTGSHHADEHEIILPRDSIFKIIKTKEALYLGKKYAMLDVRYMGTAKEHMKPGLENKVIEPKKKAEYDRFIATDVEWIPKVNPHKLTAHMPLRERRKLTKAIIERLIKESR